MGRECFFLAAEAETEAEGASIVLGGFVSAKCWCRRVAGGEGASEKTSGISFFLFFWSSARRLVEKARQRMKEEVEERAKRECAREGSEAGRRRRRRSDRRRELRTASWGELERQLSVGVPPTRFPMDTNRCTRGIRCNVQEFYID